MKATILKRRYGGLFLKNGQFFSSNRALESILFIDKPFKTTHFIFDQV